MTYLRWKEIVDQGLSIESLLILQIFGKKTESLDNNHHRTKAALSYLERKQYIIDNKISIKGEEMLKYLNDDSIFAPVYTKPIDKFEEWWSIFPGTDGFTQDGQVFNGTQNKRIKKDLCKEHFSKALNSGLKSEEIIKATVYHMDQARKLSIKKGTSQLTFIPNSLRYLEENYYQPFIQLAKDEVLVPEFKSNII